MAIVAVSLGAAVASGLPAAVGAAIAAVIFVALAMLLRMVPIDFYTAIPRPWQRRAGS